jgi:seryl-tRNA synthetase
MKKMCMDIETLRRDQNVLKKQIACCSNRDEKVELGKRIMKLGSELKILISKKERIENERWLASLHPKIRMHL